MMNLLRIYGVLAAVLLYASMAHAQLIEGKLHNENQDPVSYANIVLLSLPDSTFIDGAVSDENGRFSIATSPNGKLLRISAVGFKTKFLDTLTTRIGDILLHSDTQTLAELTVKGDLPHTQIKNDAFVTQVQGSVLEKAGTLLQLLKKIPNVMVMNDAVNVFGRGVPEIYINSRKVRDNSELEQIMADNVHAIEVVTNPGAQYDASVPAVIRIRTKKAVGDGFSFSERAYVKHNMKKFSALNQVDWNYRKDKLDVAGMLDLHHINSREESDDPIYMFLGNTVWKQDQITNGSGPNRAVSGRVLLNYTFNPEQALGIRYDIMRRSNNWPWKGYVETTMYENDQLYDYSFNDNSVVYPENRHSLNAYYIGKVGRFNVDWNTDAFYRKRERNQTIKESYHDHSGHTEEHTIESLTNTRNRLVASKIIGSTALGSGKLNIGGEFTYSDQWNDFKNPQHIMESNLSELYERSYSLFAEYNVSLGKVQLQAGLRYENINSDYYQDGERNKESSRNYSNLFPTLSLTAPLGKMQWSLRYTSGITRPNYNQLRGSVSYLSRYAYETGNPMLVPTLSTNLSTALSYKWVQLEVAFNHYDSPIFYLSKMLNDDDLIVYVYYDNTSAYNHMTASLNLSPQIGLWTPRVEASMVKQWVEMDTPFGHEKLCKPYATFVWNNTFNLPKNWVLSYDMMLETKGHQKSAYLFRNNFNADASIVKTFKGERFSLQLDANNIFGTYQADPCRQYCGENIILDLGRTKMSSVMLTGRYKFNTVRSKYKGTGAGQSQRNRM